MANPRKPLIPKVLVNDKVNPFGIPLVLRKDKDKDGVEDPKAPSGKSVGDGWDLVDSQERMEAALRGDKIQLPLRPDRTALEVAGAAGVAAGTVAFQVAKAAGAVGIGVGGYLGRAAVDAIQAKLERPEDRMRRNYFAARERARAVHAEMIPYFKTR
jgi:hypothetical protein